MSFKDAKIPIEAQLMLDYANGMAFKDVLAKYRQYLADELHGRGRCTCQWCATYLRKMDQD